MSKVSIKGNASGTGTFTIEAPNSNTDRTLVLPDEAGTVLTSASSVTPSAGPAFSAYISADQSISGSTWTKANFNTEDFDTDSCFDTSTNRFTPNVEGYYQVHCLLTIGGSAYWSDGRAAIRKNGSEYIRSQVSNSSAINDLTGFVVSSVIYLNGSTDYVEIYGYTNFSTNPNFYGSTRSRFSAALVRTA